MFKMHLQFPDFFWVFKINRIYFVASRKNLFLKLFLFKILSKHKSKCLCKSIIIVNSFKSQKSQNVCSIWVVGNEWCNLKVSPQIYLKLSQFEDTPHDVRYNFLLLHWLQTEYWITNICSSKRYKYSNFFTYLNGGCPWVRASIGMFAQSVLRSFNFDVKVIKEGIYTF
jgi:hypothetical protein